MVCTNVKQLRNNLKTLYNNFFDSVGIDEQGSFRIRIRK